MSNNIILGQDFENDVLIMYDNPSANFNLSDIAKILIPILISAGLKALITYVNKNKEFNLKYPGGKIKLLYNIKSDDIKNSIDKKNSIFNTLLIENELDQ